MLLGMSKGDQRYQWWEYTEVIKLSLTLEMAGGNSGNKEDRMRSNDVDWQQVDELSRGQWGLDSLNPVTGV